MTDIAIRCEGLSKRYKIGEQERYKALRDVITDAASAPFRRIRSAFRNGNGTLPSALSPLPAADSGLSTQNSGLNSRNSFWALDDVSFEVECGDVLAAGKLEKTLRHDREGLPKMACHASGPCVILRGAYL